MVDQLQILAERLRDAEFLHIVLEGVSLYGLLFGLIFFVASFALKEQKIQLIALAVIGLSALISIPHMKNRRLAESHMIEIRPSYSKRISDHTELRASRQIAYYAVAIGAVLTVVTRKSKAGPLVMWLTIAGAGCVFLMGLWLHMKEAEILQPNILLGPGTEAVIKPYSRPER